MTDEPGRYNLVSGILIFLILAALAALIVFASLPNGTPSDK
jgi:hypothetical protein